MSLCFAFDGAHNFDFYLLYFNCLNVYLAAAAAAADSVALFCVLFSLSFLLYWRVKKRYKPLSANEN